MKRTTMFWLALLAVICGLLIAARIASSDVVAGNSSGVPTVAGDSSFSVVFAEAKSSIVTRRPRPVAEATISGPSTVRKGATIVLHVSGLADADLPHCKVRVYPPVASVIPAKTWGGEAIMLINGVDAGECVLVLTDFANDRIVEWPLTVEGEQRADPTPAPPDHEIRPGSLWLILIEESSERTPAQARLMFDATWREKLKEANIQFRIVDKDSTAEWFKTYKNALGESALPVLLIVAEKSSGGATELYRGPWPSTGDELLDLIKKHGGKL